MPRCPPRGPARHLSRAPSDPVPEADVGPGDTVAILYTSGTTGVSKGVCCPHAQYFWWGVNTARLLGVVRDDVLLTTLPLFHTNALNTFYQALLTGAAMVVEQRFSASGFAGSLIRHGATVTFVLGAMVPILLSRPASPEDRAHQVRIALAPGVPERFHPEFHARFGIALLDGYGSTETNFVLGCEQAGQRPGKMGPVFDGFEARIVDDADNTLPDGVPGELVLRASEPFAFATGYFGMPEKTVEAWRNLWFHTGDRVVREADGYYRFIDRMKDAIRRRGENISSYEVEQVLLSHPSVAEAAAFPVRSELAEDEVMAAVVLRDACRVDARCAGRVLRRPYAGLRDPALHRFRHGPADDRERQGAEVPADRAWGDGRDMGSRSVSWRHPNEMNQIVIAGAAKRSPREFARHSR